MHDNELDYIGIELGNMGIVPVYHFHIVISSVQHRRSHFDAHLSDRETCRFQRLNEASGQSDCDAVVDPSVGHFPCLESDFVHLEIARRLASPVMS